MAEAQREEIAKLEALYAAHPEGRVFTHLAEAYRRSGELGRAREILEDGLRRHPDYSSAHVVFGRVLMDLEQPAAAAGAFRRVLELDRHNLVALRSLGELSEQTGDRAAAIGYYRDLIALDPTDDRLRLTVARLEVELAESAAGEEAEAGTPGTADVEGSVEAAAPAAADFEPHAGEPVPEEAPPAEAPPPLDLSEFSFGTETGELAEEAAPLPLLEEDADEASAFEGGPFEVRDLELSADTADAGSDAADAGSDAADAGSEAQVEDAVPAGEPAVDDVMEAPGLAPGELTDLGWSAGETADTRPDEEARTEADTEPVGDEALALDDATWSSLGDRAESAWDAVAPQDAAFEDAAAEYAAPEYAASEYAAPEPASVEEIEEISTWGPAPEEPAFEEPVAQVADAGIVEEPAAPVPPVVPVTERSGSGAGGEMVTATMAELYAQQGFYDRAVDVYRQLVEQVPDDERLRERLAEVEALSRAIPATSEESESEAASVWTQAGDVAGGEETPYAWADPGAGEEGATGTTAGEYFRTLLGWRPGGGEEPVPTLELTEETEAPSTGEPEPALETDAVAAAFEEWFGEEEGGHGDAEGEAQEEEDADLAMFRSWLQSLKK